jgi:hypothetical protein
MALFINKDKNNDESFEAMTEEKALSLIKEWADAMEVRLRGKDFEDLQNEIWLAVKNERLTFNKENEIFTYTLIKPIKDKDGKEVIISVLTISECNMNDKKNIAKYEDMEAAIEMLKAYCKTTDGKEIPVGFLSRIKDRDQNIILAVILGFFVQAVPSAKLKK